MNLKKTHKIKISNNNTWTHTHNLNLLHMKDSQDLTAT